MLLAARFAIRAINLNGIIINHYRKCTNKQTVVIFVLNIFIVAGAIISACCTEGAYCFSESWRPDVNLENEVSRCANVFRLQKTAESLKNAK